MRRSIGPGTSQRTIRVPRRLAATVLAAALAASALLAASTPAEAATACRLDYSTTNSWNNGFQAALRLTNLGDALNGWALTFIFPNAGEKVSSGWQATWTQSGAQVTAASLDWNRSLASGAVVDLGLVATSTGTNPAPTSFALNGVTCTGTTPPATTAPASTTAVPTTAVPTTAAPTSAVPTTPRVSATTTSPAGNCPANGHITYTLARASAPTADQQDAYTRITTAMDQALSVYNCYLGVTKALSVSYVPSVATADANYNGSLRFGAKSTMQQITAMHEIGHTMGVGTYSAWPSKLSGGIWTGTAANAELRAITGDQSASIHGDTQHFWPYGLNYTSEVTSSADLVAHVRIVGALRRDMGL